MPHLFCTAAAQEEAAWHKKALAAGGVNKAQWNRRVDCRANSSFGGFSLQFSKGFFSSFFFGSSKFYKNLRNQDSRLKVYSVDTKNLPFIFLASQKNEKTEVGVAALLCGGSGCFHILPVFIDSKLAEDETLPNLLSDSTLPWSQTAIFAGWLVGSVGLRPALEIFSKDPGTWVLGGQDQPRCMEGGMV